MRRTFEGKLRRIPGGSLAICEPTYGSWVVTFLPASYEESEMWLGKTVRVTFEDLPVAPQPPAPIKRAGFRCSECKLDGFDVCKYCFEGSLFEFESPAPGPGAPEPSERNCNTCFFGGDDRRPSDGCDHAMNDESGQCRNWSAPSGDEVTESIKEIAHSITPRRFRLGDDFGPRTGGVLPDNDDWIGPADKKPSNVFIGPGRRRRR